jgi:hypothetical protein
LPLAYTNQLNHDTFFMRFALPSPDFKMGLPCGKHVFLCAGVLALGKARVVRGKMLQQDILSAGCYSPCEEVDHCCSRDGRGAVGAVHLCEHVVHGLSSTRWACRAASMACSAQELA